MAKTKSSPKVSIIIPTKNKATYLRGCQEALEKNTSGNYEVIIVNNNSYEEDALALLREYQNKPNFKILHYPYELKQISSLLNLFSIIKSCCTYISFSN